MPWQAADIGLPCLKHGTRKKDDAYEIHIYGKKNDSKPPQCGFCHAKTVGRAIVGKMKPELRICSKLLSAIILQNQNLIRNFTVEMQP